MQQDFGIFVVVPHHINTVVLHGVGTGALMQNGLELLFEIAVVDALEEITLVQVVRDFAIDQIPELVAVFQIVHDDNILLAALVEGLDQIGADKTRSTRDDVHHPSCVDNACMISAGLAVAAPSLPITIPAATLARCTASSNPLPTAQAQPMAAITVSPAPVTSNTSRARALICSACPPRCTRLMPSSPRVTRMPPRSIS